MPIRPLPFRESCEFCVDNIWVFVPIINAHQHLSHLLVTHINLLSQIHGPLTLRKVLKPARMLPPIHVEYLRSGGAKIFILMSLTASFCSSVKSRSPKPFVSVLPPDRTMLL